jgi:hypothetical protein
MRRAVVLAVSDLMPPVPEGHLARSGGVLGG